MQDSGGATHPGDECLAPTGAERRREDVFALRYESKNTGKSGYALQCHNRWNDAVCPKQQKKKQKC